MHERGAPHMVDPSRLVASATRIYGDDFDRLWGEVVAGARGAACASCSGGERIDGFRVEYTPGHASHHVAYLHEATGTAFTRRRRRRADRRRPGARRRRRRRTSTSRRGRRRSTRVRGVAARAARGDALRDLRRDAERATSRACASGSTWADRRRASSTRRAIEAVDRASARRGRRSRATSRRCRPRRSTAGLSATGR